jgi:ubiquinone/menaquinone biosynthesis C-methylase UbiE
VLDNAFTGRYHADILERLNLSAGMSVLDAGCGPGLLTVPVARAVGPQGKVLALDIQEAMIERAREAAKRAGLANITFIVTALGAGKLPASSFDRAILVTVLGEIPDRLAALREILLSLKPGGILSITEVLPDPHFQTRAKVKALALAAGFTVFQQAGNWLTFTMNVQRP